MHKFVRHFDGRSSHLFPTHSGWGPSGKAGLPTRKNCGPRDFRKQLSPSALRGEKFSENKPGLFCSAGRAASSRAPCTGVNGPRPHRGKAPVSPWIKKFPSRHRAMLRRATKGRLQEVPELTRGFMGATTPIAASPNPLNKLDLPDVNFYRRSAPFFSAPNCAHVRTIDLGHLFLRRTVAGGDARLPAGMARSGR